LPDYITLFGYLAGYNKIEFKKLDPVNIEAAEKMGKLHDRLKGIGYSGHQLELYLVHLLELEVLELLLGADKALDIHSEIKTNVNQFYGIEIEEFPAQIAQVAMWLVDH
jgi:hypothetical protein